MVSRSRAIAKIGGVLQRTEFYELPCPSGLNNTDGKLTCGG